MQDSESSVMVAFSARIGKIIDVLRLHLEKHRIKVCYSTPNCTVQYAFLSSYKRYIVTTVTRSTLSALICQGRQLHEMQYWSKFLRLQACGVTIV
jgi:hypothetical protein